MNLTIGADIDGRYAVQGLLGRGAMAAVYRVRHVALGTEHALKVLDSTSPDLQRRLMQEGRAQASLHHTNVVSVTDVVRVGGAPGLVMELVDGPTLEQVLAKGPLSLEQVDVVVRGLIAGVAAAHAAGLVHRDLKPGNVLLDLRTDRVAPRITDFGLAKIVRDDADTATRSGATMGTPAYMAPEQVRSSRDVDARADLFALGAILYELVSGRRAFGGKDTFETMEAIAYGRFVPIREVAPEAPARMLRAIEGCLVLERDQRTPSCEALLAAWTDGTPPPTCAWDLDTLRAIAPVSAPSTHDPSSGGTFDMEARSSLDPAESGSEPTSSRAAPLDPAPAVEPAPSPALVTRPLLEAIGVAYATAAVVTVGAWFPCSWAIPAQFVPGWAEAPALVSPAGVLVALAGLVVAGAVLGRRHARSVPIALGVGSFAGAVAYTGAVGPLLGVIAASPVFDAIQQPGSDAILKRVLAGVVSGTFWLMFGGGLLFIGVCAAIAAVSALVAELTRTREPEVSSPLLLRIFAVTGIELSLISALTGVLVASATDVLAVNTGKLVAESAAGGLLTVGVRYLPVAVSYGAFTLAVALLALGNAQTLRDATDARSRSTARFGAWVTIPLSVVMSAMIALTSMTLSGDPLFLAMAVGSFTLTVVSHALAAHHARRHPLTGVPSLGRAEYLAGGLMSGPAMLAMAFVCGILPGLSTAMLVVVYIKALTESDPNAMPPVESVRAFFRIARWLAAVTLLSGAFTGPGYVAVWWLTTRWDQWRSRSASAR